jgi:hypothetical protein
MGGWMDGYDRWMDGWMGMTDGWMDDGQSDEFNGTRAVYVTLGPFCLGTKKHLLEFM